MQSFCLLDRVTLDSLQGLAPCHSDTDKKTILQLFADRLIFEDCAGEERSKFQRNIFEIKGMIPTLHTFFEDIKYLEPCAKVMKGLLPTKSKRSIFQEFMGSYFPPQQLGVQHAYQDCRIHRMESGEDARMLAYQQLWLFALRNFPEMTNTSTRKVQDRDKPVVVEPSPVLWHDLGCLASSLGFETAAAKRYRDRDPETETAISFLQRVTQEISSTAKPVTDIADILRSLRIERKPTKPPSFSSSHILPSRRYGRPFEDDHVEDKDRLYLPQMYSIPRASGQNISTFYRKWSMFRAFMGIDLVSLYKLDCIYEAVVDFNRQTK